MPLKCLIDESPIFSFDFKSQEEWEDLRKRNAVLSCLRMSCCDAKVVLKTSKLGTRYFAHARKEPCTSAPETAEHLLAKSIIAGAVKEVGWSVQTEFIGTTSSDEGWIADVMAISPKNRLIAFEVQWSKQTIEETLRRQARYADSEVRCMWLMRQHDLPTSQSAVPAFRLLFDAETTTFSVQIRSHHNSFFMNSRTKNDPHYWSQTIELSKFIRGALKGKLRFKPALNQMMPMEVAVADINCWRCKNPTSIITGLTFLASRILPGCANIHTSIYSFDEIENGSQILATLLPNSLLKGYQIGPLKSRYSSTMRESYLSNGCVHCDAIMGRFYDHEVAWDSRPLFEVSALLEAKWANHLEYTEEYINIWWFDES